MINPESTFDTLLDHLLETLEVASSTLTEAQYQALLRQLALKVQVEREASGCDVEPTPTVS